MKLKDKDKQQLLALAHRTIKRPCEIWAYGSRVDNTAHDTSDLDLVIRTQDLTELPIEELMDFKDAIANSSIPILVQVMDWGRIPDSFKNSILRHYVVLKKLDDDG